MTKVVNIRTDKYDVYCGRAGKGQDGYFGNPFYSGTREENIANFYIYFCDRIKKDPEYKRRVEELRGKILGCFCKLLDKEVNCHCDIFVEWLDKTIDQSLGIIGSSFRKDDRYKLNSALFNLMVEKSLKLIMILKNKHNINIIKLISGGAAGADYISVHNYLNNKVKDLTLHLPCEFNFSLNKFEFNETGKVANFYHEAFSKVVGFNSLTKTREAIEKGAKVIVTPGFKNRNTKVAEQSDVLLAMTFGEREKVKYGGTWDTCSKWLNFHPNGLSYHLDLGRKLVYKGICV